ncbi:hypothetical protein NEA10_20055 [Phormidium yuhuli AB48]|uniref:Uncharacterized protein n=1 Tax=Phormidium yuhuli AB48 TaxID=2940671 RepID=A0ABY5AS87_9CYAN|nr:hypothetical protein [Phormidium yuhuli]USR91089.1 hypothetical protein NEA10_20055 [Phormidium yuhuli AB48]
MSFTALRQLCVAFSLAMLLFIGGCDSPQADVPPPPPAEQVQPADGQGAVSPQSLPGSAFNRFFPSASGEYERVYTQEKDGFAEAKLKRNGEDVAMLAISDTVNVPAAAERLRNSPNQIAGYPGATLGQTQTSILVADRFQVKVISRSADFTESDREAWLQRFDLQGLSRL